MLEPFHIFVLANVTHRPIVVFSSPMMLNVNGEELSPTNFGGIYLPSQSKLPVYPYPMFLLYNQSHFSSLVPTKVDMLVPVVDSNHQLLPTHFSHDDIDNYFKIVTNGTLQSVKVAPDEEEFKLYD